MKYLLLSLVLLFIIYNLYQVKENLANKNSYNVYLISNNSKLSTKYINKINSKKLNSKDKVVRFNHSGNPNIFPNRTDVGVFRNNSRYYWGYDKKIWKDFKNKEIIFIGKNKNFDNCLLREKKRNNKVELIGFEKINNKTESSGTTAIKHYLKNPNVDKIYLIGFTFYNGKVNWHNFKKEKEILKKYPEKIIQL